MDKGRTVLLDTSFMLRLLDKNSKLHDNALGYFKYFLENQCTMKMSTIAIAEYCVMAPVDTLPLSKIKIVPFNFDHAGIAGQFMKIVYEKKRQGGLILEKRVIIPNDVKMFSQASIEDVDYYVSSDAEAIKMFEAIKEKTNPNFDYIDIASPYQETFGLLL